MEALDDGDGIDEVAAAEGAHDVGVERRQIQLATLPLTLQPLTHLALPAGGLLKRRFHLAHWLQIERKN